MANVQKTIDIIFAGTDDVSGTIDGIGTSMENLGGGLSDFAAPFETGLKAVLAMDAALIALVATGLKVSSEIETAGKKMKDSLGLPTEEAEKFKEIALDVYSHGYGDDMAASFDAAILAQKKFGDSADTDIGKVVEAAFKLSSTFGVDYAESLSSAKNLMTNFGLSSEEAFDFIAKGYQKGLDGSGDFLESINEYSTQFSNGGADAGQFFSVLESGFQEGFLGTDRAADAFKEFRVRIQDGSKTTADALAQIGLGEEFTTSLENGEITAIQAFGTVIERLNATESSSVQMQAGVGLIGTQFEDLGTEAALALNTTQTSMDDLIGTMSDFDGPTFTQNMTAAWRTAITAVGKLGVWDDLKDKLSEIGGDISINFSEAFGDIDTKEIEAAAKEIFDIFAKFFEDNNLDLTTAEGMSHAIDMIMDSIKSLLDVTKGMAEIAVPAFEALVAAIESFNNLDSDTKELVGNILGLGTALGVVGTALAAGGALLSGLSSLVGVVSVGGSLSTGLAGIVSVLSGPAGLAVALGVAAAAVVNLAFDKVEDDGNALIESFKKQGIAVKELTDQIHELPIGTSTIEIFTAIEKGDLEGAQTLIDEITTEEYVANIMTVVDEKPLEDYLADASDIFVGIDVGAEVDKESVKKATDTIEYEIDGVKYSIEIPVEASGIDEAKKELEEIPTEKQVEIQLQGDIDIQIAEIIAQAETAQAAFQYTAEVNIANAEAAAKRVTAAFEAASSTVDSTAQAASSMFDSLISNMGELSMSDKWFMKDILEEQLKMEQQALDMQKELNEAQIAYMNAKTEAMESGEGLIKIDSTGLEPALELVMWQILEKVQVRANEESADFLLGV